MSYPSYRIVNGIDIVPHLPPARWGYKHRGLLIHIGEKPSVVDYAMMIWKAYRFRKVGDIKLIEDHSITNYIVQLYGENNVISD